MRNTIILALGIGCLIASAGAQAVDMEGNGSKHASAAGQFIATPENAVDTDLGIHAVETEWSRAHWPGNGSLREQALAVASGWSLIPPYGINRFSYTLAKQRRAGGYYDALVLKPDAQGVPVTTFGANGWKSMTLPAWASITSASFGQKSLLGKDYTRVYFAGSKVHGWPVNYDMAVACLDLTTSNGQCSGWPSDSVSYVAFDHGGSKFDSADTIAFDPDGYLYVVGRITNSEGIAVGVARLHAATGALDTGFDGDGKAWYALNGNAYEAEVTSSTFAPAGSPGGKFLYVGGSYESSTGDRDGFVVRVNPATAQYLLRPVHHESDNTGYKKDAVTALTVLANGKIAFAGWSETDSSDFPAMLLGRVHPNVDYDSTFCGSGVCAYDQGSPLGLSSIRNVRPSAIGERSPGVDLVVALNGEKRTGTIIGGGPFTARQRLEVWSPSGNEHRYSAEYSYTAAEGEEKNAWTAGMEVVGDTVLLSGWRRWSSTDTDVTVTSLLITDPITSGPIFSNGFE